jgi:TonB family protein
MSQAQLSLDLPPPASAAAPAPAPVRKRPIAPPQLLVKWTPFWPDFLNTVTDFVLRRDGPHVWSSSAPGSWPDVLVHRPLPWKELGQSGILHVCAAILIFLTGHLWLGRTRVELQDPRTHHTISYYKTEDFLPAYKTEAPKASPRTQSKHDPTFAAQEIISVPSDADNSERTIANLEHPEIMRNNIPLPNLVVSAATPKFSAEAPKLIAPEIAFKPAMPKVQPAPQEMKPEAVPQEAKEIASQRPGQLEIADNTTAPEVAKLRLPGQTTVPVAEAPKPALAPQPPTISNNSAPSAAAAQLLALNARPAPPTTEIKLPDGSRKGAFATGPLGRLGAAGTPGVDPNVQLAREISTGGRTRDLIGTGDSGATPANGMPSGISITNPRSQELASALTGPPTPIVQVQRAAPAIPKIISDAPSALKQSMVAAASPNIPGARSRERGTPEERKPADPVFGTKHVYSMEINLPNLNSRGGSWVIRFAEKDMPSIAGELSTPVATTKVDPAYPSSLQHDGVQGTVVLYAVIHADGTVGDIRVLQGLHEQLDSNAVKALSRWKFRPATKGGAAVDLEAVVQIPFVAGRNVF